MKTYPFKPKSNKNLIPGQYWAIPLKSGRYACGRVIQVSQHVEVLPTKSFLAGLMDWVGSHPPDEDQLAGHKTITQGIAHIKTIQETGLDASILGYRPLELDDITPDLFRSQTGYQPGICKLLRGLEELRPIEKEEWEMFDTLGYWGYDYIQALAQKLLDS